MLFIKKRVLYRLVDITAESLFQGLHVRGYEDFC